MLTNDELLKAESFTVGKKRRRGHPEDTVASTLCTCVCARVCGINVGVVYSLPMCSLQAQCCGLISLILFLGYYNHKSLNIHVGRD